MPSRNVLVYFLICFVTLAVLLGSYQLYKRSLEQAVHNTTVSFMEQISEHDIQNIKSQIDDKLTYIASALRLLARMRSEHVENLSYLLGVVTRSTPFRKMYLVTARGVVYDNAYLISSLDKMDWESLYRQSSGDFVTRYAFGHQASFSEFLMYGIRLAEPFDCGGEEIEGIVGLVPVADVRDQMRLESFDGRGLALVIESTGEVVTASRYYDNAVHRNYFTELQNVRFFRGGSPERCRRAVLQREKAFVEYEQNGERFYALMMPIPHSDWHLVVKVSTAVTAEQTSALLLRSLAFFALAGLMLLAASLFVYRMVDAARSARISERAKSAFLANMSHEIRTPLNGITGLHHLMRQHLDSRGKLLEYLNKAEISTSYLKNVISDVLDMSKIESGQFVIYPAELDLRDLTRDMETLLETQAQTRRIDLRLASEDVTRPLVLGDGLRLKQILVNLLGNALKFTPAGGTVSLTIRQEPERDGQVETIFVVADTGCGMSPEFLEKIWLPFEQEQRMASLNGTGLGTTLSKALAEKMGGSIEVESREGEGSTFTVRIPFRVAEGTAPRAGRREERDEAWTLAGKRILVAEDNELNREIMLSILTGLGSEPVGAADGEQAVAAFQNSPPGFYDLILMDIQMPLLDGCGATAAIRALSRPDAATVPIVALTANVFR